MSRAPAALTAVLATVLCGAAGHRLLAVTTRGSLHVDTESGALLAWGCRRSKRLAVLPHNNTACWFRGASYEETGGGQVHCASLDDLGAEWQLPKPREAPLYEVRTLAFDPTGQTWHMHVGVVITPKRTNLVCSYEFERCANLGPDDPVFDFDTVYDIPNRLLFRLFYEHRSSHQWAPRWRLQVSRLDGSDTRELPDADFRHMPYQSSLAADPVGRRLYWTENGYDRDRRYESRVVLASVNYEGTDKRIEWIRSEDGFIVITVAGGGAAVALGPRAWNGISVLGLAKNTTDPAAAASATPVKTPAGVWGLFALHIFSPNQTTAATETSGNECSSCDGLCVPTVVDGAPSATCFCPDGERLLGLRCQREHTAYAAVLGENTLEVVNLDTGDASVLLNNLTAGTRADVFWAGGEEFVLFWVDAGGLYRAQWSPAGLQGGAELLIPATESEIVVDVAVDWNQRQLVLMSRRAAAAAADGEAQMVVRVTRLDGSLARTVFKEQWYDQHTLTLCEAGITFSYLQPVGDAWGVRARAITGDTDTESDSEITIEWRDVADVVVSPSLTLNKFQDRILWLDRLTGSLYEHPGPVWNSGNQTTLVTHNLLRRAGGLDALADRVFWVEDGKQHGILYTLLLYADDARGEPRLWAYTDGGRAVRVMHPWRQPASRAPGEERCDCEQICLRVPDTWYRAMDQCACQDGDKLQEDGKTCQAA